MKLRSVATVAVAGFIAASACSTAAAAPSAHHRGTTPCRPAVEGNALARQLRSDGRVLCTGTIVRGDVDLTGADIAGVFVCNRCQFRGRLLGRRAVFERGIDLSGSHVTGSVEMAGARFAEAALFSFPGSGDEFAPKSLQPPRSSFDGVVDFSSAIFDEMAVFDGARFVSEARFASGRFRGVARFAHASFGGLASFAAATFGENSLFAHAEFGQGAYLQGAAFEGAADFRDTGFSGAAVFDEAAFGGRADFAQSRLLANASFDNARFAGDASFRQVLSGQGERDDEGVFALLNIYRRPVRLSFDHATFAGKLDLTSAALWGDVEFASVSAREISLEHALLGKASTLHMSDLSAGALSVDPGALQSHLDAARDQERAALHTVETTAKDDGDLGRANDAHYRVQVLASDDDSPMRHRLDFALYRWVAGYFVRPWLPLLWLLVLVVIAVTWRLFRDDDPVDTKPPPGRLEQVGDTLATAVVNTLTLGGKGNATATPAHRLEVSVYTALLACFLLSLANTNPTLRQMVEGVL
jgi:hypothetical protein